MISVGPTSCPSLGIKFVVAIFLDAINVVKVQTYLAFWYVF